jgi:integrase
MTIQTISDAVGVTKVLYTGRSNYLFANLDWWTGQLGPEKPLTDITPEDIDVGIGVLMATPALHYRKNQGVVQGTKSRTAGTVNRYVGSLATMFKLLRFHRRIPRSFTSPIVKGLKLPEGQGRTLQVSITDVRRLVDAARLTRNLKLPAFIAIASTTGLRKGSLQGLTWGAVDLKARTIDVATTKNGTPTRSVFPTWAAAELARIRPDNPEPWLEVFGARDFRKAWEKTIELADIPGTAGWTVHHLRHVAASILSQSGASLPVVMQALNHKTTSMALRYSHVNTKALDQAMSSAWD